jgi:hypothetical protein
MNFFLWTDDKTKAKNCLEFLQKKINKDIFVYPSSSLPYSKSKIKKLIFKFAPEFIKSSNDPKKEEDFILRCYMSLSNFVPDDEANTILNVRNSHSFKEPEYGEYLHLLSKKDDEERDLLEEIEQLYIDCGFREDLNATIERFISKPEDFTLFRGEKDDNKNGFRFTTNRDWAENFGTSILEGRLPPQSKIHPLKHWDIMGAPQTGFTTDNSWFLKLFEEEKWDAIISRDPMSSETLEILVNPKHLGNFKVVERNL